MYSIHYDKARARLFLQTDGIRDAAVVMAAELETTLACQAAARADRPLTVLAQIGAHAPQSDDFVTARRRTAAAFASAPIARFAVIAPDAAIGDRVRRLAVVDYRLFRDADAAAHWLAWPDDYVRALPWLSRHIARTDIAA